MVAPWLQLLLIRLALHRKPVRAFGQDGMLVSFLVRDGRLWLLDLISVTGWEPGVERTRIEHHLKSIM